jgi:7,8-dihydroneopterin aldolase/epimerase/oxygenase
MPSLLDDADAADGAPMTPTRLSALPAIRDTLPQADTAAEPLDLIFIDGLVGHTVIGIHDTELHRPQPLVIDVVAGLPRTRAASSDQIADTLDYGELRLRLHRLLAEHQVKLLEAFAEQIATIVLHEFHAQWVRVRVAKPHKFDDVQSLGVLIERRRDPGASTHSSAGPRGAPVLHAIGAGMVPGSR